MESAAPQTPVQALEALQNAYSRFLDALPEARRASLGEAIGFFLRSDGNPKLGSLVDAFAEELPVHVEALKTRLAACPAEEADRLATQALELMLLYPRPKDGATEFSLAAFEGFAAPLLPFLAPARRAELAERYRALTPPRKMLPNQKKLWKALSGLLQQQAEIGFRKCRNKFIHGIMMMNTVGKKYFLGIKQKCLKFSNRTIPLILAYNTLQYFTYPKIISVVLIP